MKTVFFSVVHNDLNLRFKISSLYVAAVSNPETPKLWRTLVFSLTGPRAKAHWIVQTEGIQIVIGPEGPPDFV